MLQSILKQGIPLVDSIDLDDPLGLGIKLRIFRKDATGYEEAVAEHPKNRAYLAEVRRAAVVEVAVTRGARRGKGGKVKRDAAEGPRPPSLYIEDLAEQIAEHLFEIVELSPEVTERFRIEGSAAKVDLLRNAPVNEAGQELCFPAAFRGEKREPVWNIADVRDSDEEVPWGGYGLDTQRPTLCNMIGLWIVHSSEDADLFGVTETKDGAAAVRPTSDGKGSSSVASESSTVEP